MGYVYIKSSGIDYMTNIVDGIDKEAKLFEVECNS